MIRFYTWHIFGLTLVVVVLFIWHIFRVRRDGGVAVPPPTKRVERTRISRFELVRREALAMLFAGAALILMSAFLPAPIAPAITEIASLHGNARAPWFFLWVQEMLKWGDPFLWGVLAPVAILLVAVLIPFILPLPKERELGKWFPRSNRLAQIILAAIAVFMIVLTLLETLPAS